MDSLADGEGWCVMQPLRNVAQKIEMTVECVNLVLQLNSSCIMLH